MEENERMELVALRQQLRGYLLELEDQIIDYPTFASDEIFAFLISKSNLLSGFDCSD